MDETRASSAVHVATWTPKAVKSVTQIAHEAMSCTDDLSTRERLKAVHRACPPFRMLMVALGALVRELTRKVLDLRQDRGECRRIDCRSVSGCYRGRHLGALNRPCHECGCCGSVARGADININNLT